MKGWSARVSDHWQRERLLPDLNRAGRCIVAFMVPLLVAEFGWLPIEGVFAAIAAQNIAMVDIRGSYPLRVGLLLAMAAILAGSTWLGSASADSLPLSLGATLLVVLAGGVWRHLSTEYGPPLAIASALLFLIAVSHPGGGLAAAQAHLVSSGVGALWGLLVQVSLWPFRAQHPRRRAVAESWVALSDMAAAIAPEPPRSLEERHRWLAEKQGALRTALDHAAALVTAKPGVARHRYLEPLENLNTSAGRLATRLVVLNLAIENLLERPGFDALSASFTPLFSSLVNTPRTVALVIVSRQPSHLVACEVRLQRLTTLLNALPDRVTRQMGESPETAQLTFVFRQIVHQLAEVQAGLRATVERSEERAAFSLELFDLQTWTLRPLASALTLHWPPDRALVRFVARLAVLQLIGVALFKGFDLARGYWLPLTVMVVLQPDYGATRLRAGQRFLGTLAGSLVASGVLFLALPPQVLLIALAVTVAGFAFWLKRNYAIAVVFITLFVVLITERSAHLTLAFTAERLAATAAGGALALGAALVFWPVWERERFPSLLAAALRANQRFFQTVGERLCDGAGYEARTIAAKHDAEVANGLVFASLQRLSGDPRSQRARMEAAATLANANQRLTRFLTAAAVQLSPGMVLARAELAEFIATAAEALERLAGAMSPSGDDDPPPLESEVMRARLDRLSLAAPAGASSGEDLLYRQMARSAVELSALLLAAEAAPWIKVRGADPSLAVPAR